MFLRGNPVESLLAFSVVLDLPPTSPSDATHWYALCSRRHNVHNWLWQSSSTTNDTVNCSTSSNHGAGTAKYPERAYKKNLASATWQKEIQRVIAVSAWDQISGKNQMQGTELHLKLYKLFHGDNDDPNSTSLTSQCLGGVNQFAHLWDTVELENNAPGNEQRSDGTNLVLKSGILRSSRVRFMAGTAFTMTSISASTQQDNACVMDGRAIFTAKELVLKNTKKAISFARKFCEKGDLYPKLPTGSVEDDLDRFILKKMYLEEKARLLGA
jgi:hypothetical protein